MKKRIANAIESALLIGSLLILNTPCVQVVNINVATSTPGSVAPLALMKHYQINYFIMLFLYAVCVGMCLVSILTKNKHRDGVIHSITPLLLCVIANWNLVTLQGTIGPWQILDYNFPMMPFEVCMLGAVILGFAKRSSLIAGLPYTTEIKTAISQADQLKSYKDLLDSGAITQEEYDAKKKHLLDL